MSSRDRDTKSLQDKLKVFFKKGASAPLPARNELVVGAELERELGVDSPLQRRLRALRDLAEKVMVVRVKEGGVEKLWSSIRDLLEDSNEEARHTALWFLQRVAEGQADYLQIMRTILFRYLRNTNGSYPPEDYELRFKLLHTLTNTGKNIDCFEEEVGPFLLEWLPQIEAPSNLVEFLQLIINVVKYNATYLDEHIVHGIVTWACQLGVQSAEAGVVTAALSLLEAVVSYSLLPRGSLRCFVSALCRTVNLEHYCHHSWKLMRNVVGADIGHAALHEMVQLVREHEDAGLVRGAVFYINMALWGPRRVPALHVSHLAVLPAYLRALERGRPVVTYEVLVGVQSVVSRAPLELTEPAWDALLLVLAEVLHQDRSLEPPNEPIHTQVHAVITAIEQLHDAGQYTGDVDALLDLVDLCGHERPEASALRLVSWRGAALSAAGGGGVSAALALAERYVRREKRLAVRTHALRQILDFVQRHRFLYGEELVELVGVPVLGACVQDKEPALRAAAARALVELALVCTSDACTDLVDLLEKILNRAFEAQAADAALPAEADLSDALAAASGLLELLHAKLLAPPAAHAARAFLVLLDHLDLHYRRARLLHHHPQIRLKILEMLFGLRANRLNYVGFCYDAQGGMLSGAAALRVRPTCSPFLLAEAPAPRGQAAGPPRDPPPGACTVPVGRAARLLVAALTGESDWAVLVRVLHALPALLQARALTLGRRAQDVDLLASTLCSMVAERGPRVAGGPLLSEYHAAVLPALAQLAPYHQYLEPHTEQRIVRSLLKYGMVLRTPQPYINALTIFTLEMRETMVKMLPEVLLDLSKISDTKAIASPMLEFLSTLTRLPKVFASFVEDQYMSVFAILLPYTNPSRYDHYAVSLAHHVIAAWFLKCRLNYRRNFVKFIIHGLHNYIIMPFEEQHKSSHFQNVATNEDSSNRQRSSSLGSRVSRSGGAVGGRGAAGPSTSASASFHVELTETCLDLLARYTTTPCSVKPHRSDTAEFLFTGGHSVTWLVGHKLITITTAGCLQNTIKQGPCDRCAALCRQHADQVATTLPPDTPPAAAAAAAAAAPAAPAAQQTSAESVRASEQLAHYEQHLDKLAREVDSPEGGWWRVGALCAAGACPCVCAAWAEVHVRSPTGDVSWLMRLQNQMNWDHLSESPLEEVAALLSGVEGAPPPPSCSSASSGAGGEAEELARADHTQHIHKSSSDSVVGDSRPHAHAHRTSTQPINIPGSPQRQSSSSTADEDDMLLIVPESKSRHPVRRSNSSPEMSSSWKSAQRDTPPVPGPAPAAAPAPAPDLLVLGGCEPSAGACLHLAKKNTKKCEMRVSCEAIPEEMSGTSPHTHPHLMTYKSDPGTERDDEPHTRTHTQHQLQKTASEGAVVEARSTKPPAGPRAGGGAGGGAGARDREELPPLARSKRSNTISVMSPTRRHRAGAAPGGAGGGAAPGGGPAGAAPGAVGAGGGGISPSFVFLQLYHNMSTHPTTPPVPGEAPAMLNPLMERPLRVCGVQNERTIKNLDLVPPVDTYKIGVLYVGPGQHDNEVLILKNEYGSLRYAEFLRQLGTLVSLTGDEDQPHLFLNLEKGGKDGQYTYVWHDDIMQVLFHVATAMPSSERDPSCNEKRKYIGNDYVSIVYNESGEDFNIHTIKGQLNFHVVLVEPYEGGMSRVLVKSKEGRGAGAWGGAAHCVSDHNAAPLARQVALHCALAAHIAQSLQLCAGAPYASNSLERLRLIKRVRARAQAERLALAARAPAPYAATPDLAHRVAIDDFNDYA